MNRAALMIACIASLSACNKSPDVDMKNASVEEVAQKLGGAGEAFIHAGQWQTKVTVEDMSFPGMTPAAQTQMKSIMGQQQNVTVDHCISAEEAKRPSGLRPVISSYARAASEYWSDRSSTFSPYCCSGET